MRNLVFFWLAVFSLVAFRFRIVFICGGVGSSILLRSIHIALCCPVLYQRRPGSNIVLNVLRVSFATHFAGSLLALINHMKGK